MHRSFVVSYFLQQQEEVLVVPILRNERKQSKNRLREFLTDDKNHFQGKSFLSLSTPVTEIIHLRLVKASGDGT